MKKKLTLIREFNKSFPEEIISSIFALKQQFLTRATSERTKQTE